MSPPAAWMSTASLTWSTTTFPTTPRPMCTGSGAPAGPGGREPRCCSSAPRAPSAAAHRKGDAAEAGRVRAAQHRRRQRSAGREVRRRDHQPPQFPEPRVVPPPGRGLQPRAQRPHGRHRRRTGGAVPGRRGVPHGGTAAGQATRTRQAGQGRRPGRPQGRPPKDGFATYRISVGKRHKVNPGAIVGALANEGGLHRSDFGNISIKVDHSLVELPAKLSGKTLKALEQTRIQGQLIHLSRERPSGKPSRRPEGGHRKRTE